jgi:hypothetical protein
MSEGVTEARARLWRRPALPREDETGRRVVFVVAGVFPGLRGGPSALAADRAATLARRAIGEVWSGAAGPSETPALARSARAAALARVEASARWSAGRAEADGVLEPWLARRA